MLHPTFSVQACLNKPWETLIVGPGAGEGVGTEVKAGGSRRKQEERQEHKQEGAGAGPINPVGILDSWPEPG